MKLRYSDKWRGMARCRIFLSRQCRLLFSDRKAIAKIFALWNRNCVGCSCLWSVSEGKAYVCLLFLKQRMWECEVNACRACWVSQSLTDHMPVMFWLQRLFRERPRQDYWEMDIYRWGMNTLLGTHNRTTSADQTNGYIPLRKQSLPLHVFMFHSDEWELKWTIDGRVIDAKGHNGWQGWIKLASTESIVL